jgi:hypothetical protein
MLTTTLDGLWVLQVLSGIEVLAPELGLRPHLPSVETRESALSHPVAAELIGTGIMTPSGAIDKPIIEWLTVLSRRDIALLLRIRDAGDDTSPIQMLLARSGQWWVSLERSADLVRLSGVGKATSEQSAGLLIAHEIDRLCGPMPASLMRPVSIRVDELIGTVRDMATLQKYLRTRRFEPEQVGALTLAAQSEHSRHTSIVAIQSGARPHIDAGALTIIDTPEGRLLTEHVCDHGIAWLVVTPGSADALTAAVRKLLRRLPAHHAWYSYRKAV